MTEITERETNATLEAAEDERDPKTEEAMVRAMRRYRKLRDEIDAERERGRMLLEQVRAEIAQDLEAKERALAETKAGIESYILGENGGEKFRVPGLGTAYTQTRRTVRITDYDAFLDAVDAYTGGKVEDLYDEPKPNAKACKDYAAGWVSDEGELLPGVEAEETTTLNLKFTG